jgi:hypothetical protein
MNKYNSNGIDYEMITVDEFNNLEKKWQKDSRSIPYECYVAKTNDGQYLAMDNSTGECFVDEFSSKVLVDEFFTDSLGYDDNYSNIQKIETKKLYY